MRVPRDRDWFPRLHLTGHVEGRRKRLQRAVDVVVPARVGVVGVVQVRQDDVGQPLDRLEPVRLRHHDPHRAAALGRQPLAVELVGQNHGRQVVGVFQHAADRQGTAKHLLRVVVVVAVVEHPAEVLARPREPEHLPQRHAFPEAHPERAADVQAGHHLREPDRVFLTEPEQAGEVEGGPVVPGELPAERGRVVGVGDDLQPPGVPRQPDLALSLR